MPDEGTLTSLLGRLSRRSGEEDMSVRGFVDAVGHRAFPALILVPALIITSPASGIPGLSSLGGLTIAMIAAQYALGRRSVWLPQFILKRSLPSNRLKQALSFLANRAGLSTAS